MHRYTGLTWLQTDTPSTAIRFFLSVSFKSMALQAFFSESCCNNITYYRYVRKRLGWKRKFISELCSDSSQRTDMSKVALSILTHAKTKLDGALLITRYCKCQTLVASLMRFIVKPLQCVWTQLADSAFPAMCCVDGHDVKSLMLFSV